MFKQLTLAHSLYHINQDSLDIFKDLAIRFKFEEDVSVPLALNSIDNHAVILHIWCMLNEDEYKFLIDNDKIMAYASNYYCLNLLKNDKKIRLFLQARQANAYAKYVLSYYLAYVSLKWVYELIVESEEGVEFIEKYMTQNYFLFSAEEQLIHNEEHHFYITQKFVTQLMASDYTKSKRYEDNVNTALNLTRNFLNKHIC